MSRKRIKGMTPRIEAAIEELKGRIRERYPEATYEVAYGDDPEGVYLTATVDVEDTTEVFDVISERLLELQVEEELPLYVVPAHTPERVMEAMRQYQASRVSHERAAISP